MLAPCLCPWLDKMPGTHTETGSIHSMPSLLCFHPA